MVVCPFCLFLQACFAFIILDGDLDLSQDLFAGIADNRAQGSDSVTGIEIEYAQEILMLKVVARIQPTAGHERVGGAYSRCVFERNTYVIVIILFQEGIGKDAEDIMTVVVPIFGYELRSNLFKLIGKPFIARNGITLFQGRCHSILVFVSIFPQKRAAGIFPTARVCNIENVFEPWIIAAGIDQRNAPGTTANITPHLLIPKVIVSTSSSVRFLSKNHQLLMERILIEPTGSFKERCPFTKAAGYLLGCMIGHLSIEIQFTRHPYPPR